MKKEDFHKQATIPDLRASHHPKKIGPYKIESLLSEGGMSALYLGIHPETHEPIVIKVLLPKFVKNPQMIARFLKEAQIIAVTNHPNIVRLYGQGEWENGLYIAMEFIYGVSLSQFIQKKSLSLRRALEIVLQVAYALSHLHAHGVIHRDLKPENILINDQGEVKVIDFGIAQLQEEKESGAILMGTPVYMSPEQREHPSSTSFASDIYSLGIIAYELILGRLSHGAIHLELLSQPLRAIIGKALEKDLHRRYADIVDFINDISHYLETSVAKEEGRSDEMVDLVQKSSFLLIQKKAPDWSTLECGIAWREGEALSGLYLEFFRFNETHFLTLLAEPIETGPVSLLHGTLLRGMVRMSIDPFSEEKFQPIDFLNRLNGALFAQDLHLQFSLTLLLLDPEKDQLSFISCRGPQLAILSEGSSEMRILSSLNPLLGGEMNPTFMESVDNWRSGDTLFLHTTKMEKEIGDEKLLSAQHQAERLLEKSSGPFKKTAVALCLQRIF